MSSILDEFILDKEHFEGAIAVGMSTQQLLTMFDKTGREMDEWCKEQYGRNFATTYEIIRQISYKEFLDIVRELGGRGNPSALNIINEAINSHAADNVVRIVFDNNMKKENEEDKNV